MKKLLIVDSHALIHRAWHALPRLTSPDGRVVNAVYGFAAVLLKALRELRPDYVVAAFDLALPTFREKVYAPYKATRAETPSELESQFPIVREFLQQAEIPILEAPGFEADDVIGTIASKLEVAKPKVQAIILSGDLDTLQLVRGEGVVVLTPKRGVTDTVLYDEKAVRERYGGLLPRQLADLKGLKGDPSDNIPGVKGIGEKTAVSLLQKFESLESIFKAIEAENKIQNGESILPPKLKERLRREKDRAFLSRMLGTIRLDAPIVFSLERARFVPENLARVRALFEELGFRTLLARIGSVASTPPPSPAAAPSKVSIPAPSVVPFELKELIGLKRVAIALSLPDIFVGAQKERVHRLSQAEAHKLAGLFEHDIEIAGFDLKPLLKLVSPETLSARLFDIAIVWWLLHPHISRPECEAILRQELGASIVPEGAPSLPAIFLELVSNLSGKLEALGLANVFQELEMPLVPILADMEERGIMVEESALTALSERVRAEIRSCEEDIYSSVGEEFRIASPQALRRVLFDHLKLHEKVRMRKTPGGLISTEDRELVKIEARHPIVALIRKWRELSKLESTYLTTLGKFINPETRRIHPTFVQTGTVTGRLSCENPNLQNIPAGEPWGREVRNLFVASSGFSLVSFDYSQLELRLAAHLSGDEALREVFERGDDVHRETAAAIFGIPISEVSSLARHRAKTLNFGVLYGMGATSFAEVSGISRQQAKEFIESYFKKFPGLRRYFARLLEQTAKDGYLETLFGRKRFFPAPQGMGWRERGRVERAAVNFPIQGSGADLIKLAMARVDAMLRERGWHNDSRALLQIHDELLFEIRDAKMKEIVPAIHLVSETVFKLAVPLQVDVKRGKRWGSLERL